MSPCPSIIVDMPEEEIKDITDQSAEDLGSKKEKPIKAAYSSLAPFKNKPPR